MSNEYLEPFFKTGCMKNLEQLSVPKVEQVATEITTQNLEQMVNTITEQERKDKIMSDLVNNTYIKISPQQHFQKPIRFFWQVAKKNADPRMNYGRDIILQRGIASSYKRAFKDAWLYYQGFMSGYEFYNKSGEATTESQNDNAKEVKRGDG